MSHNSQPRLIFAFEGVDVDPERRASCWARANFFRSASLTRIGSVGASPNSNHRTLKRARAINLSLALARKMLAWCRTPRTGLRTSVGDSAHHILELYGMPSITRSTTESRPPWAHPRLVPDASCPSSSLRDAAHQVGGDGHVDHLGVRELQLGHE